jgi:hypothetical protein
MNCALLPRLERLVKVAARGPATGWANYRHVEGNVMTHLRWMVSYLLKSAIIFVLIVSAVPLQVSMAPAAAQGSSAPCPAGYWRYASLCLNNTTGDVVLVAAVSGQAIPAAQLL